MSYMFVTPFIISTSTIQTQFRSKILFKEMHSTLFFVGIDTLLRSYFIRAKRVSNWYTPQKKSARLPACTCQIILVLVFTYVSTTYVRTSARYQPATKIRICIYVSTEKHRSAIIVHKPNRTATSTWTVHRKQNKPYRLGAASAGVVGTRSRCCPAATVRAAVVFACGFRCSFAD